jgi:hypothetical protein
MNYKIMMSMLLMCLCTTVTFSQKNIPAVADQLYKDVQRADSLLFQAFNTCDSLTYLKLLKDDIEFYHDLGGLNIGTAYEMKAFREMCARGNHIRRELVKSSLEVYPIKGYGAVEMGVHTFYHTNKGQTQEKVSGTYKFVQVWQFNDGFWKLARVISYGHNVMHNE